MSTTAVAGELAKPKSHVHEKMAKGPGRLGFGVFGVLLVVGLGYAAINLVSDLGAVHSSSIFPYVLLGIALLVALAFEFVNGFHDTANAVATVIYTHSLDPHVAVAWSGLWNFVGVLVSTGGVAFGIISLLPVELILQVGNNAGFAMVFALLTAAIIWNLGTWYFGLPSSSSHTLIGSIIGVGLMNQLMAKSGATSGVDWAQASKIGQSLLLSPLIGFGFAALMLLAMRKLIPSKKLYTAPEGPKPPPFAIRCLLLLTCTGVSFAHGSNDGQKGMGLIMLILIGTVPTAYALNHAVTARESQDFIAVSEKASSTLATYAGAVPSTANPRDGVTTYIRSRQVEPDTVSSVRQLIGDVGHDMARFGELKHVPADQTRNFRNDMYLIGESLRLLEKSPQAHFSAADLSVLKNYHQNHIDKATKFIPGWVKVAVAIALGLGTMIGWKRIVVTVGERIGKDHLTYGQGAAAEITAMLTIGAADFMHLPVSTTHVLSSGVAGTMAANKTGLQWSTVRSLLMAWVLTLPVSIVLSGSLFFLFSRIG